MRKNKNNTKLVCISSLFHSWYSLTQL